MKISTSKIIKVLQGKKTEPHRNLPAKLDFGRIQDVFSAENLLELPHRPYVAFVFVTKGGVLKSSLTQNLARLAAWQGLRTLVIGLDLQADISRLMGAYRETEHENLDAALAELAEPRGLYQFFNGEASLEDIICPTDLPGLSYIPETAELATLDQSLFLRPRRELWLKEAVIEPLKNRFDLILMDGAPSWSLLTTNALTACDALLSPIECKINNFRNLKMFNQFIAGFKKDLHVDFSQVFIPTRFSAHRKLSQDILKHYRAHLSPCINTPIKDSVAGEEASALRLSVCESSPFSPAATEMRQVVREIFSLLASRNATPEKEALYVTQP